jgi:ribosomal protein S18 acetylase RimI-like enzyme
MTTAQTDRRARWPLRAVRRLLWHAESRLRQLLAGVDTSGNRLFYALDIETAPAPATNSPAEFRELSSIANGVGTGGSEDEAPSQGLEGGQVVGMIDRSIVYRVSYVRGDGGRLQGLPAGWQPRSRVILLHDGYTDPAFRGRGVHSAALRWLLARAREEGIEQAVCVVHADNPIARRSVTQLGFRCVGPID